MLSRLLKRGRLWAWFLLLGFSFTSGLIAQDVSDSFVEDVSTEDVKKFLDPTAMNDVLEYRFQANFLSQDTRLFSHRPYVGYSFNYWSAVWAEVPIWDFSIPKINTPSNLTISSR